MPHLENIGTEWTFKYESKFVREKIKEYSQQRKWPMKGHGVVKSMCRGHGELFVWFWVRVHRANHWKRRTQRWMGSIERRECDSNILNSLSSWSTYISERFLALIITSLGEEWTQNWGVCVCVCDENTEDRN